MRKRRWCQTWCPRGRANAGGKTAVKNDCNTSTHQHNVARWLLVDVCLATYAA